MSYFEQMSSMHIDILKEIGNIGAGNAATALAKIVNKKIAIEVPDVRIVSFNEMVELAGGAEQITASIYLRIEGDVSSHMFFILPVEQAEKLLSRITGKECTLFTTLSNDDFTFSAFKELGNILVSSYISSLSDFTGLIMKPSVPAICIDMLGAILSYGFINTSLFSDRCIVIETIFTDSDQQESERIEGHFFFFPDPDSFTNIFQSLGVALNE